MPLISEVLRVELSPVVFVTQRLSYAPVDMPQISKVNILSSIFLEYSALFAECLFITLFLGYHTVVR